ncbi:asparaginase [Roseovarius faecimaris]|uniref:Asparaginase n=1 Tax=Roseovarius faecimaris TaxID=2494550 RepID=A0A6I6ISD1_9RHOB|nr:asparaginase [Roseovarius faecimaris]QGX99979.1 asparaginase [Roseovarius faecimaris]
MTHPVPMVEIWRGPVVESQHSGHAVICDETGQITQSWGNPDQVVYPRSSAKMIQALPLIESGAADAQGLTTEQLALACASHSAAAIHTVRVMAWLDHLGLGEPDLRCGPQEPEDIPARDALIRAGDAPCQVHNNCSGKHCGFLTLNQHLGGGPDYIEIDHPVQRACLAAFEEVTDLASPGWGIDGCSAPNFLTTLHGMARAMAFFAAAREGQGMRATAAARLRDAMIAHPELVAGESRACTQLMRACTEPVALKTGAEGFFIAILPRRKLGVALKITDGAGRASESAIAALLVRLGVLDAGHPAAKRFLNPPVLSRRGFDAGQIKPSAGLL